MRVGCVYAKRRDWPKWDWVSRALSQLGHEVVRVNEAGQLAEADETCGLLLFEHRDCGIGRRHVIDRRAQKRAVWALWWWDLFCVDPAPLEKQNNWKLFGGVLQVMDRVFVKERSRIEEFQLQGVAASYMDQCCPSNWGVCEHREHTEFDVLVFGSADPRYASRINAVRQFVSAGFSVGWASHQGIVPRGVTRLPWCHPKDLVALMGWSRCVLDVDFRSDVDGYRSDRHWLIRGAGAIPVKTVEDVENVSRMTLGERRDLGANYRRGVMNAHTYEHRLRDILAVVQGLSDVPGAQDGGDDKVERQAD